MLDGKKTYEMLVGAFTTNDMTPDQIYDLGIEMLNKLYPEVRHMLTCDGVTPKPTDTFMMSLCRYSYAVTFTNITMK
jgi:uncharacterized protein (DUF885 family)